jgi:hypothetical protein
MAIIGTGLTMADIARRLGGDQPILVDALTNANSSVTFGRLPMRQITGWVDQFTRIEGRPTVSWRRIGGAVAASKGNRNPYSEGVFMISGVSEVDKVRADRDPRGPIQMRSEEDWSYLEAIGYGLSLQLFYGGTSMANSAEAFDGMCKRLPTGGTTGACVDAGGSLGCSVYAFKLGAGKFMGIYNTGPSGKLIDATDYGAILDKDVSAASDSVNEVYKTFFNACFGVAQYHALAVGRIEKINGAQSSPIAAKDFTNLYAAMEGKPDLFVTTWKGWGGISALLSGKQVYAPGQTDYAPYVGSYDGVPIIVDSALTDDYGM